MSGTDESLAAIFSPQEHLHVKRDTNADVDALRPRRLAAGWLDAVLGACIAGIILSMGVVFSHVDLARTYHTGFEPYDLVVLYAMMTTFGVLRLIRAPKRRWVTVLLVAMSVASMATIVWLDRNNVVVEYNRWIRRGMPAKPF